ncbi:hypothetical protein [Flavobacterium sp. 3HN19-14]|uniref:hypothetical protein n=1 Tax=Flavobacterium sp. 3HN19-14 TaxID=3448133 RepID=UPI003EE2F62F
MQNRSVPFTFSFYDCMDEDGNSLHKTVEAPLNLTYRQLFYCNYVGNLTGIYDAEIFGKIEISSVRKRQDWMLWLSILKKMQQAQPVPESLAIYRIRGNSVSASKWELIRHNFAVYRIFHKQNFISAVFSMCGFLLTQLFVKPCYIRKNNTDFTN